MNISKEKKTAIWHFNIRWNWIRMTPKFPEEIIKPALGLSITRLPCRRNISTSETPTLFIITFWKQMENGCYPAISLALPPSDVGRLLIQDLMNFTYTNPKTNKWLLLLANAKREKPGYLLFLVWFSARNWWILMKIDYSYNFISSSCFCFLFSC